MVSLLAELPNITLEKLIVLQNDTRTRKHLLRQMIASFEIRYGSSLLELERKLDNLEIEEHPAWEDSIEWRNALEQLDYIQLSENIFEWLQNLLTPSVAS